MTTTTIQEAAEALIRANIARAAADKAEKECKARFADLAAEAGETAVVITDGDLAGAKVSVVTADRAGYDIEVLKDLFATGGVSRGAYYFVTQRSVDAAAWKEAIRTGRISEAAADKVVSHTPVERIVVTVPRER